MANLSSINKEYYLDAISESLSSEITGANEPVAMPERSSELLEEGREQRESSQTSLTKSELERFLNSSEHKPENSTGYAPYLTPVGNPVFSEGKVYFAADYGTPIVHSGPSGEVVELKTVPNGTEREVVIQSADGTRYTYYGIGGGGFSVGDEVKSGQVLSYTKMHFDAVDSVGVQISVTSPDGENITESAFSRHTQTHPIVEAAERDAVTEKPISKRAEYTSSEVDKAAHQVFAGDRKVLVSTVSPTPTLEKPVYRAFKGFDGLGADSHLTNGIVVNGLNYGDVVVSPMSGTIVHQKDEPSDTLAVSLQMENGDIMTVHGLRISPSVGTKVEAGQSIGYVGTTDGEIIISTQGSKEGDIPHRPSYYLNRPSLMTSSREDWNRN